METPSYVLQKPETEKKFQNQNIPNISIEQSSVKTE